MDIDEFRVLLKSIQMDHDPERSDAEYQYSTLTAETPDLVIKLHIQNIESIPLDPTVKMSLVLLGRLIKMLGPALIDIGDDNFRENFQNSLIEIAQRQDFKLHYLLLLADDIARVAQIYLKVGQWPEFNTRILELCTTENPIISAASINCLSQCINNKSVHILEILDDITSIIETVLTSESSTVDQIICSLQLLYACTDLSKDTFLVYSEKIPEALDRLPPERISDALSDLSTFVDSYCPMLLSCISSLTQILYAIIGDQSFTVAARNLSLLILAQLVINFGDTLIEEYHTIIQVCVLAACDYGPGVDNLEDEALDCSVHAAAEDALEEVSNVFGGNSDFAETVFSAILDLAASEDPGVRSAAFMSLARVFPNCTDFLSFGLSDELTALFSEGFAETPDISRNAAFVCFTTVLSAIVPDYTDFNPQPLLQPICDAIASETNASVLASEIMALKTFIASQGHFCAQYVEELTELVDALLQQTGAETQVLVLNLVQVLAERVGEEFAEYAEPILSFMIAVLDDGCATYDRRLFFACLRTAPFIRDAADPETFSGLADALLQFSLSVPVDSLDSFSDGELDAINVVFRQLAHACPEKIIDQFDEIISMLLAILAQGIDVSEVPYTVNRMQFQDVIMKSYRSENIIRCYMRPQVHEISLTLGTVLVFLKRFPEQFAAQPALDEVVDVVRRYVALDIDDKLAVTAAGCIEELLPLIDRNDEDQVNALAEMFRSVLDLLKRLTSPDLLTAPLRTWKRMVVFFGTYFSDIKQIPQTAVQIVELLIVESRERHQITKQAGEAMNDVREEFICEDGLEMKIVLLMRQLFRKYRDDVEPFFLERIAPLFPLNEEAESVPAGTFKIWTDYYLYTPERPIDLGINILSFCARFAGSPNHSVAIEAIQTIPRLLRTMDFPQENLDMAIGAILEAVPLIASEKLYNFQLAIPLLALIKTFADQIDIGPLVATLNLLLPLRAMEGNEKQVGLVCETMVFLLRARQPNFIDPANLVNVIRTAVVVVEADGLPAEARAQLQQVFAEMTEDEEMSDLLTTFFGRLNQRDCRRVSAALQLHLI